MPEDRASSGIDARVSGVAGNADLGSVADALIAGRDRILAGWLAAAQQQPFHRDRPERAVADHIPPLFDAIVDRLRRDATVDRTTAPLDDRTVVEAATGHAQTRFEQGLGPVAVVTEFRLLRQEVSRSLRAMLDDQVPASDVVAGLAIVSDALDGAATVGLAALSDRVEGMRETFLATTLHDVRQPITLVEGSLRLAERWLRTPEVDRERVLGSIEDALLASDELVEMIDTMSDASQVAMGALAPDPEPASLTAIVREAIEALGATARPRIAIEARDDPRHHLVGLWDPRLLRRVVANLAGNALKYSPPASPVTIVVCPGPAGFARLTIQDVGLGMTAGELSTAFERFVRADRARRMAPGLGLGLFACHGIIAAHGGTMTIHSDGVDQGTLVTVDLPLLVAEPDI